MASVLPSKSAPTTGCGSRKRKCGVDREIEDGDSTSQVSEHNTPPIDNSTIDEDMHVDKSNAPQEKQSKKEVCSYNY